MLYIQEKTFYTFIQNLSSYNIIIIMSTISSDLMQSRMLTIIIEMLTTNFGL